VKARLGTILVAAAVLVLTPCAIGQSQFTVLYNFNLTGGDGTGLWSGVAFDQQGNLYGTTAGGGLWIWHRV
jgi:hypothetical protein